jgi:hypothetical protein
MYIQRLMEVSIMMAPKPSKSQVGADFCCGWRNCHIWVTRTRTGEILDNRHFFFSREEFVWAGFFTN